MILDENATFIVIDVIKDLEKQAMIKRGGGGRIHNINLRSGKPIIIHNKKKDEMLIVQELIEVSFSGRTLFFSRPNDISLSLNIANKAMKEASIHKENINKIKVGSSVYGNEVECIYDYLEEIQKAIIFSYKSVESLCNSAIPNDYKYKKEINKKGISEEYSKEGIERWVATSEKLSIILPQIYNCDSPNRKAYWSKFKELEKLRNEIIHSKSNSTSELLSFLLTIDIASYIQSCYDLIEFFFDKDRTNLLFPVIVDAEIFSVVIDDIASLSNVTIPNTKVNEA